MLKLKPLPMDKVPTALRQASLHLKANESTQAESVCHDILLTDPKNQQALVILLLSLTERFGKGDPQNLVHALEILPLIRNPYDRAFHAGVICDRLASAFLNDTETGSRHDACEYFREAMTCYEKAEKLNPAHSEEARLRYNACARMIEQNHLDPWPRGSRGECA